ncbi:DUF423 domain-containing protein [Zeaxanthinibacter sp. PT1]|uniref:DUF423 domain-containing protein n=1 Tax=Zeaxanthinibacter TaxID=561554 RepID=UPI0023498F7F|nr:DUF423 domain-containing protein [Zeaxanthinibacter sp. PT1]MDC6350376.1 DUF423 domain-containing protein [Zeaxanthinibacter sp. PT1]
MILLVQFTGALLGMLGVIFGAFGAHRLKDRLDATAMKNFETGVKYQFYHALVLLMLGFNLGFNSDVETYMAYCFILGTVLFSFSIYALSLGVHIGTKKNYLGIVTPLGGLLLVVGWALLLFTFIAHIV